MEAIVSQCDYEFLRQYKWTFDERDGNKIGYACRFVKIEGVRHKIYMHRLIVNPPPKLVADHRDGHGLHNARDNLRIATPRQNKMNHIASSLCGLRGVCAVHNGRGWRARIWIADEEREMYLGAFETKEEAARAYDRKAIQLHGEFAWTNYPREEYPIWKGRRPAVATVHDVPF